MKPLARLLALGALLLASASFAAESFTGKIDMQMMSAKDKNMTMVYSVKPDATRIDIKGQPMSMIFTPAKKEMVMLMHENKMYMTHTIDVEKMAEKRAEKQGDKVPDIEATGKTEVICGYTCNQYISRDGKNVTEMWIAEGLGAYMSFNSGGGGGGMFGRKQQSAASAKWEEALKGKGGFPLRVITQDAKGKETFRMEATKVEKGGVSDADFLPPKDYQAFQMPNLGDLNPFKKG